MNRYDTGKLSSTPPPVPYDDDQRQRNANRKKYESVLLTFAGLAAVFFAIMGMMYMEKTLVSFWIPAGIAAGTAVVSLLPGIKIWEKLFSLNSKWLAGAAHMVFSGTLVFFLIVWINYAGADFDKGETVTADITRKFIKEHTRSNGGRRHHGSGTKYNTWHIEVTLPDGRRKELQITHDTYYRLRNGGHLDLRLTSGSLGMDVIEL